MARARGGSCARAATPTGRLARTATGGLAAVLLLAPLGLGAPAAAAPVPQTAAVTATATSAAAVEQPTTPLQVSLESVDPGVVPRTGTLVVEGQVTNVDDRTWRDINVYTFLGSTPIDDRAELAQATAIEEDQPVGDRITETGTEARIRVLRPGESEDVRLRVPSRLLLDRLAEETGTARPGVYWFGLHALGADEAGRDGFTDGRARTFLPLLPAEPATPVATTVVLPLRAALARDADGALSEVAAWGRRLSLGGRLRDRLEFGAASGTDPVSWLVDPGLVDAVRALAGGNQARSIAPTDPAADPTTPGDGFAPDDGPSASAPSPSPSPSQEEPGTALPGDSLDPETAEVAARALTWLDRFESQVVGDELLVLPYGDLDVAGALTEAPQLYDDALTRTSPDLRAVGEKPGVSTVPVVAPRNGYLDPAMLGRLGPDVVLLGSDAVVEGSVPTSVDIDGQPVVLSSTGAAAGGPAPEDPLSTLALRQRILAEAALRLVEADAGEDPDSLVVVMPDGWTAQMGTDFFTGLDVDGVELSSLTEAVAASTASTGLAGSGGPAGGTSPTRIDPDAVLYPERQRELALGERLFDGVVDTRGVAATLQNVLARNSTVGSEVDAETLGLSSYAVRRDRSEARRSLRATRAWLEERLGAVQIDAPEGVTLSGAAGRFSATLLNRLDEPVEVRIVALADDGIEVPVVGPLELAADSRTTVPLEADAVSPGVHNVTLTLVDTDGTTLPGSDRLPIRSAQVSNVIWLIMGAGVALLLSTIAVRAVRRLRGRIGT